MNAAPLDLELRPRLASKAKLRLDPKTGKYILLYPEKGLLLNPTGAAILKLCTGEHTLSAIIASLGREFQPGAGVAAPEAAPIQAEVLVFVQGLLDRGLVVAEP